MLAFGAHVAFEGVHLDLDAFVLALGLRRLAPVHDEHGGEKHHQQNGAEGDAENGLVGEVVGLHHLVLQVANREAQRLADAHHHQWQVRVGAHPQFISAVRLEVGWGAHHLGHRQGGHVAHFGADRHVHVIFVTGQVQVLTLRTKITRFLLYTFGLG